jgi:hypothetical protein
MQQVFQSSLLRKRIKPVTVKGLSPMQNIWILHSKHIGRLAPMCKRSGQGTTAVTLTK